MILPSTQLTHGACFFVWIFLWIMIPDISHLITYEAFPLILSYQSYFIVLFHVFLYFSSKVFHFVWILGWDVYIKMTSLNLHLKWGVADCPLEVQWICLRFSSINITFLTVESSCMNLHLFWYFVIQYSTWFWLTLIGISTNFYRVWWHLHARHNFGYCLFQDIAEIFILDVSVLHFKLSLLYHSSVLWVLMVDLVIVWQCYTVRQVLPIPPAFLQCSPGQVFLFI